MSRFPILGQSRPHPAASPIPVWTGTDDGHGLVDAFGRRLTYLRVSVTDRCNFRCTYCLPEDADFPFGDRAFLSPEEIETIVGTLVRLGIRQGPADRRRASRAGRTSWRSPGGSRPCPGSRTSPSRPTAPGSARLAPALKEAGVDRVNISVDSLDPERFREITRRGDLEEVWRGVEAALAAGLHPVKLNAVLLADGGLEDAERLAALTLDQPLHVRFIEMMPTEVNRHLQPGEFLSADAARDRLEERFGPLVPTEVGLPAPDRPRPSASPARSGRWASSPRSPTPSAPSATACA